jgi:hypothetical protein
MTADGRAVLTHWARGLEEVRGLLIGFLERYERDRQAHLRGSAANGAGPAVPATEERVVHAVPAR